MPASVLCVGNATLDRIWTVERLPRPGDKMRSLSYLEVGGGQAANAAVAAARLGGHVRLVSAVGDDAAGRSIEAQLRAENVDVGHLLTVAGARSISSVILVEAGGERVVVGDVDPQLYAATPTLDAACVAGMQVVLADVKWPAAAEQLLAEARRRGVPTVLDVEPAAEGNQARLCPLADHAIFSHAGLIAFTGVEEVGVALRVARDRLGAVVGVTLGSRGVLMLADAGPTMIAAPAVAAVDTTGAGDAFHGAYALAVAEGRDALACARFAAAVAALKCTRAGRSGLPSRADVERFMAQG